MVRGTWEAGINLTTKSFEKTSRFGLKGLSIILRPDQSVVSTATQWPSAVQRDVDDGCSCFGVITGQVPCVDILMPALYM